MYPDGATTTIDPGPLAHVLEGAARPGHFAGVATVVMKLFAAVEPDRAYFGEKDLQQVAVVRRVAADLDAAVDVVALPTVREHDGLALSSRNRRLTTDDRHAATCIWRALETVRGHIANGTTEVERLRRSMHDILLAEPRCRIDYAEIVDRRTFDPARVVDEHTSACIAAWFGEVRLIDNIRLA
jgi:pantoate--beta-alanine ligase